MFDRKTIEIHISAAGSRGFRLLRTIQPHIKPASLLLRASKQPFDQPPQATEQRSYEADEQTNRRRVSSDDFGSTLFTTNKRRMKKTYEAAVPKSTAEGAPHSSERPSERSMRKTTFCFPAGGRRMLLEASTLRRWVLPCREGIHTHTHTYIG